ncbi:MAG: hypothetical protein BWY83_01789 [bacterium ADurb.Bin478]|nr:MAG: hypothetical protein BWY83_01789 [bacterium ADurb.Bin478]
MAGEKHQEDDGQRACAAAEHHADEIMQREIFIVGSIQLEIDKADQTQCKDDGHRAPENVQLIGWYPAFEPQLIREIIGGQSQQEVGIEQIGPTAGIFQLRRVQRSDDGGIDAAEEQFDVAQQPRLFGILQIDHQLVRQNMLDVIGDRVLDVFGKHTGFAAADDLRRAHQPGPHAQNLGLFRRVQLDDLGHLRTGTHQAHVPFDHVEKLR